MTGIVCPDERYAECLMRGFDSGKFTAVSLRFMGAEYAEKTMRWKSLRRILRGEEPIGGEDDYPQFQRAG